MGVVFVTVRVTVLYYYDLSSGVIGAVIIAVLFRMLGFVLDVDQVWCCAAVGVRIGGRRLVSELS